MSTNRNRPDLTEALRHFATFWVLCTKNNFDWMNFRRLVQVLKEDKVKAEKFFTFIKKEIL